MRHHGYRSIPLSIFVLVFGAAACSGGEDKGDGGEVLTGNMSGAVGLALAKPAAEDAFAFVGAPVDTSGQPFFTLVKIDADGNVDPVFNQQRPIHWVEVNDTHVAVSGFFDDVAALVEDDQPQSIDCRLVTFPRTATGESVKCITTSGVGFPSNDPQGSKGVVVDYPGFTAKGSSVYFTELEQQTPETGTTRVWKWDGGSDVIEQMLQLSLPLALAQPFAMNGGNHLCAMSLANGHPSGEEALYCTSLAPPPDWAPVGEDPGGSASSRALVLGSSLVTGYSRVSLLDGTVTLQGTGSMPSGREHTILVGDTAWGLSIGTGQSGGDLVRVTSGGQNTIDATVDWERIAGVGNAAYVYGASQLRRLDLRTGVFEAANLLGSTTLLQVTDISLSTGDNIRLDGTTSSGLPAIVLVNTSSGEITVTQEDVPRFQSVTPLE